MSLKENLSKLKGLEPEEADRILTAACTRWLEDFNKRLEQSKNPLKLVESENENLILTLVQLTRPQHQQLILHFYKILASKPPR